MRARQRYLGILDHRTPPTEADPSPLELITFASGARRHLQRQLYAPGWVRGGMLYGSRAHGALNVLFASTEGYPWWYHDPTHAPLEPDERYALGWSDCVEQLYSGRIDWIGNWMTTASRTLGDERDDLSWLDRAAMTGLMDDAHVLMVVGWKGGLLSARAYCHTDGVATRLTCDLMPVPRARAADNAQ